MYYLSIMGPKHSRINCRIFKSHGSSVWRSFATCLATCLPLLLLLVFLLLMLMPMLMMLALTLMLLLYAFHVVAYADDHDANADEKMPNDARHLASACVVVMMPTLLQLLRQLRLVMMQC